MVVRFSRSRKNLHLTFLQVEPDRLSREAKSAMIEIIPAGALREIVKFAKRKCARGGEPPIVTRHRFAKENRRQQINADRWPEIRGANRKREQIVA